MVALRQIRPALSLAALMLAVAAAGCAHRHASVPIPAQPQARELSKLKLPEYVIEPPDILQIDMLYAVPLPPYRVQTLDSLAIQADGIVLPGELPGKGEADPSFPPIAGVFPVDPDGTISLPGTYGTLRIVGMTLDDVRATLRKLIMDRAKLKDPRVEVTVAESRGLQQIRGPHLVRPDGSVSLGTYGSVNVTGLTLTQAKRKIEVQLTQYLQNPEVTVDVTAYNSKVFYVVLDGGGAGQQVVRLPITGNETVLDAISQINGLSPVSDTHRIWVSRPTHDPADCVLPVDWTGITARGRPETNYQLMPGDRVFVQADPWVTADTKIARRLSPFERIFGFSILTASTIQTLKFRGGGSEDGFGGGIQ